MTNEELTEEKLEELKKVFTEGEIEIIKSLQHMRKINEKRERKRLEELKKIPIVYDRPLRIGETGLAKSDGFRKFHIIREQGSFHISEVIDVVVLDPVDWNKIEYTVTNHGKVTMTDYHGLYGSEIVMSLENLPEFLKEALLQYSTPRMRARFEKKLNPDF